MKILVTGAAGFIGFHTSKALLNRGDEVVAFDNLNAYYDPKIKESRLEILKANKGFKFLKMDLSEKEKINSLIREEGVQKVVHLAAQAGVRYSIENPQAYVDSNVTGFLNILEACKINKIEHLVFASTSSVYGSNKDLPFSVEQKTDSPISIYAATKKANELMAHTYAHLFQMPCTGLRFFTVYGPWGRPDMALFLFVKAVLKGEPINVFNRGDMRRDFTYVDDIVEGIVRVLDRPQKAPLPFKVYNIGNNNPVSLLDFIDAMEKAIGKKAIRNLMPMQPGDVQATFADVSELERDVGFKPATPVALGVENFVKWYREYFKV